MNEILMPLTQIAGVRLAALITPDGVPIALLKREGPTGAGTDRAMPDSPEDFTAYAGLAAGWLGQVARATDPLTWNRPRRAVLRGTRGTLIMNRADNAILMVVVEQGVGAEELRLPMESALSRMQRHLRGPSSPRAPLPSHTSEPNPYREAGSASSRQEGNPPMPNHPVENCFSDHTGSN